MEHLAISASVGGSIISNVINALLTTKLILTLFLGGDGLYDLVSFSVNVMILGKVVHNDANFGHFIGKH